MSDGRNLTLAQYIVRRNGVPAGARGGLRNMLSQSLGASSFAGFWRHWNPVFGYALGRFVFVPLKRIAPPFLALVATFVFSGLLHDAVTALVRGAPAFFFTPWFFFLGVGVLGGQAAEMDISGYPWGVRAAVNLAYVVLCLLLALAVGRLVG